MVDILHDMINIWMNATSLSWMWLWILRYLVRVMGYTYMYFAKIHVSEAARALECSRRFYARREWLLREKSWLNDIDIIAVGEPLYRTFLSRLFFKRLPLIEIPLLVAAYTTLVFHLETRSTSILTTSQTTHHVVSTGCPPQHVHGICH
jgi:hypothetical protein